MKPTIIAISGKIGSGKDEFAKLFAELSFNGVERHCFADKVRDVVELIVGKKMSLLHEAGNPFHNPIYNYSQEEKNLYLPMWNKTIGQCLQLVGTDVFRERFDKDTWVKALFSTTGKSCIENGRCLIIPDCRFPNEADTVIDMGGIVIRMEGDPKGVRLKSTRDLNHESETALDGYTKFTEIIHNDIVDINILRSKIINIMDSYDILKKSSIGTDLI